MSAQVLFHPQLRLIDAARIAHGLGGRLVWSCGRLRIRKALRLTNQAAVAVEAEDYDAVLRNMRAARAAMFGGEPCAA